MPPSKNISFDELSKYFHLPINQVAKELGVCATILKKICRRNGIPRWPHRKIKSLDKMITNLEVNLSKNPTEKEEINHEVELLKNKRQEIMKNPDILVSKNGGRGSHSKQGITSNMKKTKSKRGVYTVNTFKVRELSQAEEEDYSSSDEANCWATPSTPNKPAVQIQNPVVQLSETISASIAAARRPSLPILEVGHVAVLATPTTINLPPPIRRHSIDSFPIRATSFSLSGSTAYHSAPAIDFSQKLPAFNFNQTSTIPSLPCIEPQMNNGMQPALQEASKSAFPEWFIAEKNRVLGYE